ncbi:hypothetical protein [Paenisporosarcina indica]|uniref:hypothetical protein n=1 Tax=Paenisporosarcina indica TaxID=650093 RepID=UPI00094FBA4A|nr:hypothetical protein [Paenisporosarcina indica]
MCDCVEGPARVGIADLRGNCVSESKQALPQAFNIQRTTLTGSDTATNWGTFVFASATVYGVLRAIGLHLKETVGEPTVSFK